MTLSDQRAVYTVPCTMLDADSAAGEGWATNGQTRTRGGIGKQIL